VWRYRVATERVASFEQAYGSDGRWAQEFATGPGFLGTQLVRGGGGWYLTIDHWESADRWHSWLADNREEYSRLDRTFAELTELEEEEVLSGESISGPQGGRTDR
jgi:heme-degrading monooxygenase HmoA